MYAPSPYKTWLRAHAGRVPHDLTISGMQIAPPTDLGEPTNLDDVTALDRVAEAIAQHHGRPTEEAIPAMGTSHALWLAYASTLRPGDDVLVETPVYEPLVTAAEGIGAMVRHFERRPDEGYALDTARIVSLLGPKTKLVSISNLHNPSGVRAPDATIEELAKLLATRGVHLHVDEVYASFDTVLAPDGRFTQTARRLGDNVLASGSLTKVFGLGLHRIGWLLAPPAIAARARGAIDASIGHPPVRWANMAIHAFTALPKLAPRSHRLLGKKRETVAAWMRAHPEILWSSPAEGLYGMGICRNAHFDIDAAIERGFSQHGVVVVPGRFFAQKNGFRLAWSLDEELLPEALTRLEKVFSSS